MHLVLYELASLFFLQFLSHLAEGPADGTAGNVVFTVVCLVLVAGPKSFELVVMAILLGFSLSAVLLDVPVLFVSKGISGPAEFLQLFFLGARGHVV